MHPARVRGLGATRFAVFVWIPSRVILPASVSIGEARGCCLKKGRAAGTNTRALRVSVGIVMVVTRRPDPRAARSDIEETVVIQVAVS